MNKKAMGIVLAIIIVLGGGYLVAKNMEGKTSNTIGEVAVTHKLSETPVMVPKNPEKTIVFDYGTLDTLDTLNVDVAGVARSNMPEYLNKYEGADYQNIGTLFEPDYEMIAKMQPDVIFISGRQADSYEELSKIAPTIYTEVNASDYMGSLQENVSLIGSIYGKEKEADAQLKEIENKTKVIQEATAKSKINALITLTNVGEINAYGPSSRFGIIHNTFGFVPVDENIEEATHGQNVSYEYIVEKNPETIFVVDRNKAIGQGQDGSKVFENDLMKNVAAYKNNRIIFLDGDAWYLSSGGIQSTYRMISDVAELTE